MQIIGLKKVQPSPKSRHGHSNGGAGPSEFERQKLLLNEIVCLAPYLCASDVGYH